MIDQSFENKRYNDNYILKIDIEIHHNMKYIQFKNLEKEIVYYNI